MTDVTRILSAVEHGDSKAAHELLPLVEQSSNWQQAGREGAALLFVRKGSELARYLEASRVAARSAQP